MSEYGPVRAGVDLVFHQVDELEHVDVADGHRLVERFAGAAVEQLCLAVDRRRRDVAASLTSSRDFGSAVARRLARTSASRRGSLEPDLEAGSLGRAD